MDITRRTVLGGALAGIAAGAAGITPAFAEAAAAPGSDDFGWAGFVGTADLYWRRLPKTWYEGPFLGNGFLGSGIYAEPGQNAIRFNVQHSQVQDHRPEFGSLFGLARLPIGYFTLEPVGAITAIDWRMDLWNAELTGTITTAAGSLSLRAIVHTGQSLLAVEITAVRRGTRVQVGVPPGGRGQPACRPGVEQAAAGRGTPRTAPVQLSTATVTRSWPSSRCSPAAST